MGAAPAAAQPALPSTGQAHQAAQKVAPTLSASPLR